MIERRCLILLLAALAAGCGREEPVPEAAADVVTGSVAKGPLRGATVDFFLLDAAGAESGSPLVASVTTDGSGAFTVSGLPAGVPILAKTSGGQYVDESDPEPNPAFKRRITFGSTDHLEAVLPPGATTVAITPYSMAMYKKAVLQAAGSNFANVYAAVRTQATSAFGFDPITTIPADPVTGAGGSRAYAMLLGAAALRINQIAVTSTPEHLPGYADVIAFVDDFADGRLDGASLAELVRRFRNNNISVYSGTVAPSVNEAALSQPAPVPNVAPTIGAIGDQTIPEGASTGALAFTVSDTEDTPDLLTLTASSSNTTLVPVANIVFGGSGGSRTVTVTPVTEGFGSATITVTVTDTDNGSASEAFLLTVTNVNDAPAITSNGGGATAAVNVAENTTAVTTVTASDIDGDTPTFGIAGGADAAAFGINATSGALAFLSAPDFEVPADADANGVYEVTVSASDGALSDTQAISVTVTNVDEPPSLDVNAGLSLVQGATAVIGRAQLSASDVDSGDGAVVFDVTTPPANGAVEVSGVAASSFTLADLAIGLVAYRHDGSATTSDSFAFTLSDASGFSPDCPSVAPCTFSLTISAAAAPESVLPYLTAAGDLLLFNPADPANPVLLDTGVPLTGFEAEMFLKASVSGGVGTNLQPARFVYILNGTVRKVNLEPGQARTVTQVSNITDACRFNGVGDDFANPDNSIVRVDTAGTDGICGTADDFATAPAWLVPLTTVDTAPGVQVGVGHCCGIAGIGATNGALTAVLVSEDDGSGTTFDLTRRNVGLLNSPIPIATFDIGGTGQVYSRATRGLGEQNIYVRASPSGGADGNYRLLRFNADNTLTELFDYGVSDASVFVGSFDESPYDVTSFYFTNADATLLLKVDHTATGPGQATTLASVNSPDRIARLDQTANRVIFQVAGPGGGVYSVPKAGGAVATLAADDAAPTIASLSGTATGRVFINIITGLTPDFVARAVDDDGVAAPADTSDAQWAGETFQRTCDFSASCEHTIAAQSRFLRHSASTTDAVIELADPETGAPTGNFLPTISGVETGLAAFASGFGRYAQFTFFSVFGNTDIWLGDSQDASPTPPGTAWDLASADSGGDDQWLTFGSEDDQGGGTQDSDLDGLTDAQEASLGTDPFNPDSDFDGLSDFDEVNRDGNPDDFNPGAGDTDPTSADTDADGALDGDEVNIYATDPLNPDSDADDIGDGLEITYGSDPLVGESLKLYVDGSGAGSDVNDGLSWATAIASNGEVANRLPALDVSRGPDGLVYVLYQGDPAAPTVYPTFSFVANISNAVFIGSLKPGLAVPPNWTGGPPSAGELGTVFDPSGDGGALEVSNAGGVVVDSIVLTGGAAFPDGGGLRASGTAGVLGWRLLVSGNQAGDGGGLGIGPGGFVTLAHSTVENNTATGNSAGGLGGGIYNLGSLTLDNVRISGNTAGRLDATNFGFGGGLYTGSGTTVLVANSLVFANIADGAGGGLFVATGAAQPFSDVTVQSSTIDSNQALRPLAGDLGGNGGGVCASGPFSVIDSVVSNNTAEASFSLNGPLQGGGGINAFFGLVLNNSKVIGNRATQGAGGGVLTGNSTSGRTTIEDSLLADNHSFDGPGGGLNLIDVANTDVRNSRFLSNSSSNFPGGGLHLHMAGDATIFNNLFAGNHSNVTNSGQPGGGVEIENFQSTPILQFNSNTVAYNQIQISGISASGGLNISIAFPGSSALRNNIIWFNDNADVGTPQPGDNAVVDDGVNPAVFGTQSGNNVDEGGFAGSIAPADPQFQQGYYLAQPPSFTNPSVNGGDDLFSNVAGFGTGSGFTTDPAGAEDAAAVDIGFHHAQGGSGTFDAVLAETPQNCGEHIIRPQFSGASNGEPGHLITVHPLTAVSLSSLTTIDPPGPGDVIARDRGDGTYAFDATGAGANVDFEVYADDQGTARTVTLFVQAGC